MRINKCDLCKKEVSHLETIILNKRSFDYCKECQKEAEKIKEEYKKEIEYEYAILESRLKSKENNIISKIRQRNNKGIVIKE